MEETLIDAYLHQHNLGNRNCGTFTTKALDEILAEMRQKFSEKILEKSKIKDHMKRLKSKFGPCYDIFRNDLSDFGWDSIECKWIAESEVWARLIEVNPQAAAWKNRVIPFYDKMAALYGQDRASGDNAETAAELDSRIDSPSMNGDTIDDIDVMMMNNDVSLDGLESETGGMPNDENTASPNIGFPCYNPDQGDCSSSQKRNPKRV